MLYFVGGLVSWVVLSYEKEEEINMHYADLGAGVFVLHYS